MTPVSVTAVHQFVPSLAPRDAIGSHTLRVASLLEEMGLRSEIFVDEVKPGVEAATRPYRQFARHRDQGRSWLLYQSSIASPISDFLADRPEPKLVNYHNVTPASLLERWDPFVGEAAANGRRQMERLATEVSAAFAVSRFNEQELIEAGYRSTRVVPLLVDLAELDREVDEEVYQRLLREKRDGGVDLLFVGRITPNKAQHDLLKALVAYRRAYDPKARLRLVGGVSFASYHKALVDYAAALGLADAVDFAGSVPPGSLAAHYRAADVFVCLSDHEGFCVPVLEAMHNRVPVVAYAAAAVPETVGDAGLLLASKDPAHVAAAVHRVASDADLRATLASRVESRLSEHALERSKARFAAALETVLEAG